MKQILKVKSTPVSAGGNNNILVSNVPVGSVIAYDGDIIPAGYEEVEDYMPTYSLEEQRIGTWVDGKPLYRKVLYIDTVTTQILDIQHGIENPDLIINYYGRFTRPNTYTQNVIPASCYTDWQTWLYDFTQTSIRLRLSPNQLSAGMEKLYVVLEYTKTAD